MVLSVVDSKMEPIDNPVGPKDSFGVVADPNNPRDSFGVVANTIHLAKSTTLLSEAHDAIPLYKILIEKFLCQ